MVNPIIWLWPPGTQTCACLCFVAQHKSSLIGHRCFYQITQRLCTQSVPILSFRACRLRRLLPPPSLVSYAFLFLPHFSCVELCRKAAILHQPVVWQSARQDSIQSLAMPKGLSCFVHWPPLPLPLPPPPPSPPPPFTHPPIAERLA